MSERATLDSYIETLQILAREGDDDRTDVERERDAAHRAKLIDAYAHELAEEIRRSEVVDVYTAVRSEYGMGLHAGADLIDTSAGLVRPGEETT